MKLFYEDIDYIRPSLFESQNLLDKKTEERLSDNLNISSAISEKYSYILVSDLNQFNGAELYQSEKELWPCKIDYTIRLNNGEIVGVSVTRCYDAKSLNQPKEKDVLKLLKKKLEDLKLAMNNEGDWKTQVLHVWVRERKAAKILKKLWKKNNNNLISELKKNTLLYITKTKSKEIFQQATTKKIKNSMA